MALVINDELIFFHPNSSNSFYRITYLYYSVIGTLVTVAAGWMFSIVAGEPLVANLLKILEYSAQAETYYLFM